MDRIATSGEWGVRSGESRDVETTTKKKRPRRTLKTHLLLAGSMCRRNPCEKSSSGSISQTLRKSPTDTDTAYERAIPTQRVPCHNDLLRRRRNDEITSG